MLKRNNFARPEDEFQDLGLGTKFSEQRQRIINRDGSFNVYKKGMPVRSSLSLYHELISMSWVKFTFMVIVSYVIINSIFAFIYMAVGIGELEGIRALTETGRFWDAFFFSGQTLTTVGFGRISPIGFEASVVAAVESMCGLLGFALATGLLYGRFSLPNAKIIYSETSLIAPYRDMNAFMFRIINARKNQLIELEIQVMFTRLELLDGTLTRHYYLLDLERKHVTFFPLSWTIVHPIKKESPLYGVTPADLEESDAEFLILLRGFDDTFSQTVHSRSSYTYKELVWGAKYEGVFINKPGEITKFDMGRFHSFSPAELKKY
ncbi:MAG: ion channel [Methanococcaceae archaeon]